MSYKGRITGVVFVGGILLFIREMVKMRFGDVVHILPLPALIPLGVAWFFGRRYDTHVFLSSHDALTGLYNRRYVWEKASKLLQNAHKDDEKCAIFVIDVNDFKEINDSFGHNFGDFVLEQLSAILTGSFSKKDIIARWGGDEFLIFSTYTDESDAERKITTFMKGVESYEWHHRPVTVSIGRSTYPTDEESLKELIAVADSNMYVYKEKYKQHDGKDNTYGMTNTIADV
ncbi:GGDEF domain-containing protein [Filibacter tadaridae]|uniref:Response regulator PleD n=1 Tax=Filibacter tadaridae TaxID=2483811 RepID=A0A3P5WWH4_9BACL|nr:Response regulator PleD [Filibacter tadaridae]